MILKEYSKLILNESSKLVLRESSKLVLSESSKLILDEADDTIKQENGTVIIDKLPSLCQEISTKLAQLGKDTFDNTELFLQLNEIQKINFDVKNLLSKANNVQELEPLQKKYTSLQTIIEEIKLQTNKLKTNNGNSPTNYSPFSKYFQDLVASKNFTELSKDITTALDYIKDLIIQFTDQS